MIEKVGQVSLNYEFYKGVDLYSDGDIEDEILEIVKTTDDYKYTNTRFSEWPILYHLSRQRENIAEPMDIKDGDEVLEIGSGMGAITGALAKRAGHVDCIELSKRRSMVNAHRHKEIDNIEIFVGNFQDIKIKKKYNVITLIGVLEYAKYYIDSKRPFHEFLNKIKESLADDGRLYIAIENRLGMKYFAGYNEDHLAKPFIGIEGYGEGVDVRTFTYSEIRELLNECGFNKLDFVFPFPDYKLPQVFYDEKTILTQEIDFSERHNYDSDITETFNQVKAFRSLKGREEAKYFANSFLVEAVRSDSWIQDI